MRSRPVKRIADVRGLRAAQFVEDAGPLAHPVRPETYQEINNFYTSTVYEKGAEVVRMVQTLIGQEKFRAGMDLYFARHDGEAATVEQFIQCFADASRPRHDAVHALVQPGRHAGGDGQPAATTPRARPTRSNASRRVPPTPGQPAKEPMVIPLGARPGRPGRPRPAACAAERRNVERGVLVLSEPAHTFEFTGIAERPVLSINRGFSAPIKLTTDLDADDLAFLAAHDSDPFNRWQALQTISMRLLIDNVAALRAGKPPRSDDRLIAALAAILDDATLEPAFVALALVPPGEGDIAREIGRDIDPDAIFRARTRLRAEHRRAARRRARRRPTSAWPSPAPIRPMRPAPAAARLRNVASICWRRPAAPEAIARAARQYDAADNMTDRMAALATLSLHAVPERERALADFYARYAADALVIDKWFSLQAMIPQPDTLDRSARSPRTPPSRSPIPTACAR